MNPTSIQNGANKVPKSLLEAILQKSMKKSILIAIYYTLGMSANPQNHQHWNLCGEKIVTKCIMKASLQKSHQKVTNLSKSALKKGLLFRAADFRKPPWKPLGAFRGSEIVLGGFWMPKCRPEAPKMTPKCCKSDPKMHQNITLGSHAALQPASLTQGRQVPRSG